MLGFPHGAKRVGGRVFGLDVSDDGSLVAVGCMPRDGSPAVRVFRVADGEEVAGFGVGDEVGRGVSAGGLVVHAPGLAFVGDALWFGLSARGEGPSWWCAPAEGPPVRIGHYTPRQFGAAARSPDGRFVTAIGDAVEIRDLQAGGEIVRLIGCAGAEHEPPCVAFGRDGDVWIYGREPGRVVQHDLRTQRDLRHLDAPTPFGRGLAVSRSGRWVLVSGQRGTALWDVAHGRRHDAVGSVVVDFGPLGGTWRGLFSPDETSLVLVRGRPCVVDLTSPTLAVTLGPKSPARGTAVAVAAASDEPVYAWATDDDDVVWLVEG